MPSPDQIIRTYSPEELRMLAAEGKLKIDGADLVAFHERHREYFKFYTAVLRVRNLRQLKRIYREIYLALQDEISFAGREHIAQAAP